MKTYYRVFINYGMKPQPPHIEYAAAKSLEMVTLLLDSPLSSHHLWMSHFGMLLVITKLQQ